MKKLSKLTQLWHQYLASPNEETLDAYRHQFILQAVRKDSSRWGPWQIIERAARKSRGVYVCAKCGRSIGRKERAKDHIDPVVAVRDGFKGWDVFLRRLFMAPEGGQILCRKPCHAEKTKAENKLRRDTKNEKKIS